MNNTRIKSLVRAPNQMSHVRFQMFVFVYNMKRLSDGIKNDKT